MKAVITVGILVMGMFTVVVWYQWTRVMDLESELASQRAAIHSRARAQGEGRIVVATSSPARAPTIGEPSRPAEAQVAEWQSMDRKRVRAELDDPSKVAVLSQRKRLELDARYSALFRQLGLGAEKTERLKQILVERFLAERDAYALSDGMGVTDREHLKDEVAKDTDTKISKELGPHVLDELKEYEQLTPLRQRVELINTRLAYAASEMERAQRQQFLSLLRDVQPPSRSRENAINYEQEDYLRQLQSYHEKLVRNAASFLSGGQTAAFASLLQDELRLQELSSRSQRRASTSR